MPTKSHSTIKSVQLRLEALEAREVPAVGITLNSLLNRLEVVATQNGDEVSFVQDDQGTTEGTYSHWDDTLIVTWKHGNVTEVQEFPLFVPDPVTTMKKQIQGLYFMGGKGNDLCVNNTVIRSTQFGRAGNDRLYGGLDADYLMGGLGSDWIYGNAGPDLLDGRGRYSGDDDSSIDNATDRLFGGDGPDILRGYKTKTVYLHGEEGDDSLFGSSGQGVVNYLYGGAGQDYLNGGYAPANKRYSLINFLVDTSGGDRFVCGHYAINHVKCKDNNPVVPGWPPEFGSDRIRTSYKGLDLITRDVSSAVTKPDQVGSNVIPLQYFDSQVQTWGDLYQI